MADGVFRTEDLTLATVLAMEGFKYTLSLSARINGQNRRMVTWEFEIRQSRQEELQDLLAMYTRNEVKAEVKNFVAQLALVRARMYDFSDEQGRKTPQASSL